MRVLIIGYLFFLGSYSYGQDSLQMEEKKEKKFRFLPLPAVAVTPTTGLMSGIAPGAYWVLSDPSNTLPSSALGSVIFTLKSNYQSPQKQQLSLAAISGICSQICTIS